MLAAHSEALLVGDAFASVRVDLAPGGGATLGELVVVEGVLRGASVTRARIVSRSPGRLGGEDSELFRLAGRGVSAHLVSRAVALRALRDFFEERGFLEVETPVRVPSPGLDAHVDAVRTEDGAWLSTSPELAMKRLLVGGFPRVFQVAHVTRKGELGRWHQPEFTMLEWYRAFADVEEVMADTEAVVRAICAAITGKSSVVSPSGQKISLDGSFRRISVRDAFRKHAGVRDAVELASSDEDRYFQIFVDQVEPALASSPRPLFLTRFPASQGALARPCDDDPSVVERFELYVGGIELCNGFGELTDPDEQHRRFLLELTRRKRAGAPLHPIDEPFLASLREGLPPAAGNALGLDRLIALCVGAGGIAETMAFPARARE